MLQRWVMITVQCRPPLRI